MSGGRTSTEGVYLLDLEVGGHVFRFATETVEVTDADGLTYRYAEGLSDPGASYGSVVGVGDASVSVSVLAEIDWALLVARGHALDRCPAVLRLWYAGRELERARVVLRGLTAAPTYGALGEPLQVSIARSMRDQTRLIPPVQAVVDPSTWPVTGTVAGGIRIPDAAIGASYPLVVGAPGHTEDATPVPCVPVPQAEFEAGVAYPKVIWLGGHATQVRLRWAYPDPPQEFDLSPSSMQDALGRVVQFVLSGESRESGRYLIGFRDDDAYGGGIRWRGKLLRGAGDVLDWVLSTFYDGPIDHGRLSAVRAALNRYQVDTYINSPVSAWEWLSRAVLPMLPVELRDGPRGIFPALIRYDLTRRDAVAHLDATPGSGRVTRSSPVTLVSSVANEVSVDFRPVSESGSRWLGRVVVTGAAGFPSVDRATVSDTRVVRDPLCTASQARYGVRPLHVQAGATWDAATAALFARQLVARRAWPRRAVQYVGGPWLDDLELGQGVLLTDPDLYVTSAVALVADVIPGPGETAVDLLLLDSPLSGTRATT